MKQGEFDTLSGSEAIRFSGGQFRFAIETLDDARRNRAAGPKPVEDQVVMASQAPSDFLHRFKATAHRFFAPRFEKLRCPLRVHALPESLKVFTEQKGLDALEIVLHQIGEPCGLAVGEILRPFEQTPPRLGEDRLPAVSSQLGNFLSSHLINGHVLVPHDVESIKHVDRSGDLLGDHWPVLGAD